MMPVPEEGSVCDRDQYFVWRLHLGIHGRHVRSLRDVHHRVDRISDWI